MADIDPETARVGGRSQPERLSQHDVCLVSGGVRLRPMTEEDWTILLRWYSDPDVLYYCEGDDVQAYSLEDIQGMYRTVSQTALCFIIEHEGRPVGECWLQHMNLDWVRDAFQGQECWRVDIMLGEKGLWGRGVGSTAIRLLSRYAFEADGADIVFACGIADYNPRSQRAFARNGFAVWRVVPEPPGRKAATTAYLMLSRERYLASEL